MNYRPPQTWRPSTITSWAQHHDLRVLRCLAASQQDQPAKDPDHEQVQQTGRHEPRSCPNPPTAPNRSSQTLHQVLNRYRGGRTTARWIWSARRARS